MSEFFHDFVIFIFMENFARVVFFFVLSYATQLYVYCFAYGEW